MLTAQLAAWELIRRGHDAPHTGMDDPTVASYPYRWWWDGEGVLCLTPWRGPTTRFYKVTLEGSLDDKVTGGERV